MYHKPRMCRTCLQMMRGDFKFVNLDETDPLWESNSPNLKDQLIYIVPEMKLESPEAYICTSCFIALRTAYEFKRMCQVTEQKFQNYNYKYRRPFGVGPGSPQFHVTLNENASPTPNFRCQNLNYLQTDTSIDITEHHLYDASKVLPRKQLAYLNNVTQKLPEIDVEVIVGQNGDKQTANAAKEATEEKKIDDKNKLEKNEPVLENKDKQEKKEDKTESKEEKVESKIEKKEPKIEKKEVLPEKREVREVKVKEAKDVAVKEVNEVRKIKETIDVKAKETQDTKVKETKVIETKEKEKIEKEEKKDKKEVKVEPPQDKKIDPLSSDLKADLKSGNTITLPNLPGIEIVPRKLDPFAIRKKYNIGSQISILKTPKSNSGVDAVITKACEEISYLKSNNIAPEALNCAVRLEYLSSEITMKNTKEKYSLNEMKALAIAYYSGCCEDVLPCKSCDRVFSTNYWLNVHEEEHVKEKKCIQFNCTKCSESFKDSVSLENHRRSHITEEKPITIPEITKSLTSITKSLDKDTSINDISKITVPLLANDQISLTPIPKDKKVIKTGSNINITKIREENSLPSNEKVEEASLIPQEQVKISHANITIDKNKMPVNVTIDKNKTPINVNIDKNKTPANVVTIDKNKTPANVVTIDKNKMPANVTIDKNKTPINVNIDKNKTPANVVTIDKNKTASNLTIDKVKTPLIDVEPPKSSDVCDKVETTIPDKKLPETPDKKEPEIPEKKEPQIPEKTENEEKPITPLALPSTGPPENAELPVIDEKKEKEEKADKTDKTELDQIETKKSFNPALFSEQLSTSIVNYISKSENQETETKQSVAKVKTKKHSLKLKKRRLKPVLKKRVQHIWYFKCFICFRVFKSKLCLYQHCKFIHIPCASHSEYWSNRINAQKQKIITSEETDSKVEDKTETEVEEFVTPARTAKSNRTTSHICNICDKRVAEARFLTLHMFVHTPTYASMDPDVPHTKNGDVFKCYLCEKSFPKERYLKLHNLQVHLTKTIICKICNREFKSDFWYSQHKCIVPTEIPEPEEEVEDETNQFPCTVCNRKFARLRFMKSHRHRMHKNLVNQDGTLKTSDEEKSTPIKSNDADEDTEDNDENYESENDDSESQKGESTELKQYAKVEPSNVDSTNVTDRAPSQNEIGTRRSLSRGVPKIQCDFCGDYIEETVYDKHIFEHNKLRLDKSLSKRKSLDSTVEETEKKAMMKCPVCSKPFKRKYNLNVHISKFHEGVETVDYDTSNVSELNETGDDEEKSLSDNENLKNEPSEVISGQITIVEGGEIYECCDRTFKLKAHFYRHFKIKHPNAVFKPIYINEEGEVADIGTQENIKIDNMEESIDETEIKPEEKTLDQSEVNAIVEPDTKVKETERPVRKKRRRRLMEDAATTQPLGKRNSTIKTDETDVPLTTNNKRKLTAELELADDQKPSKRQKVPSQASSVDESTGNQSDESEDMEATAQHLRQLDLLPVANKNTLLRYECHICEKRFKQKCQLRDHFNVHTGDKPYKCDFCNPVRGFTQTSSLYVHFRRVHAVVMKNCVWEVYSKNGECIICSDIFDKHFHMFKHMKDHYIKKEFECHVCNGKFNMSCHYKVHNINPGDMQHLFVDDDLEMDEENPSGAEEEVKTLENSETTDEKIESDTDSSNLADKLTGSDENKPSKCTKCKKSFPNKQQLRFHKKSLAHIQTIQSIRKKVSESPTNEVEDTLKTDTDTIEDIENGVKAIIKKIRTFKKHHCNICSAAFIKRMHLKKHKRRHKIHHKSLKARQLRETMNVNNDTEMEDVANNQSSVEQTDSLETTEKETLLRDFDSGEQIVETNPAMDFTAQLVDKVPADTEIISITATNLTKSEETVITKSSNESKETCIKAVSELTEQKRDGGSKTEELGSFDVILKLAESTSDLNKQFLFKQANTSRAINLDIPKCSSNSHLNLSEEISSQNTVIELPESTITYINPNQSDISLVTTGQGQSLKDEKTNKNDIPELDFTIEVSKCIEITSISDTRTDLRSCNLNTENNTIDTNVETNENCLNKIDSKSFYSNLNSDLVILPISENSLEKSNKIIENKAPLNDLSFHIVETPASDIRNDVKSCDSVKSVNVSKEQFCVQSTPIHSNVLEIHEVITNAGTTQSQTSVSDKYLDLGK